MERLGLTLLAITIVAHGPTWHVEFPSDWKNVGLILITECRGKTPFFSYDFFPVEGDWTSAEVRRQPTPKGERCTVDVQLQQNPDGAQGNPENDESVDGVIVLETQ